MNFLRDKYNTTSFRGRLLLLLIGVSLVQGIVAAFTFYTLQVKPAEQRIEAQLNANLRAVAPQIDNQQQKAEEITDALISNRSFLEAIVAGEFDKANLVVDELKESEKHDSKKGAEWDVYVTDVNKKTVVGKKPSGLLMEKKNVNLTNLTVGPELVAELHVPVVVDTALIKRRFEPYSSDDVAIFVVSDSQLLTAKSSHRIKKQPPVGVSNMKIGGKDKVVYVQQLGDSELRVGSAIPAATVAAEKRNNLRSLIGFIWAMSALMIFVSIMIARSVGDALKKFAGVVRQIASGDLGKRVPVVGGDEIADLSSSFNDMAANLQERINGLVHAQHRIKRQLDLFGDALANATDVSEMLHAIIGLALESSSATHARAWTLETDDRFRHVANMGLRPDDRVPSEIEKLAMQRGETIITDTVPAWMVVPILAKEDVLGLITMVNMSGGFDNDDVILGGRLAAQSAVAIDNARLHAQLREQATKDGLTGLANHRSMQDYLREEMQLASLQGAPLGVALMDIDNFKSINDTHGHHVGDEALRALAKVLNQTVGGAGFPARYGGEEFVVVIPGCDADTCVRIADRVREEISYIEVPLESGGVLQFTASFGVSNIDQWPKGQITQEDLIKAADMGLYRAKHSGKNRVVLCDPHELSMPVKKAA